MSLRLALIGAGRIAQDYVLVLEQRKDLELVACVDPDPEARQRAAALATVPTHESIDALLAVEHFDAALIASPPATHADAAVRLLDKGCHVFCEKPLATSVQDARTMLDAAERANRTVMMASKFRFVPDVAEARKIVQSGTLGEIAFYQNSFCSHVDMVDRWNSDPAVAGGGVLIDNGTHSVDLARFLIGPIARVSATFGPRVQPIEVEDSALLLFESERRTVGRIELSWSVDRPSDWFVELHGSLGTLQIGWRGSRYRTTGEWTEFGTGYDKRAAFRAQLEHFADIVSGDREPIIGDEDAMASVRIVDAAYRAAERGTWESVAAPEPVS